MKSLAWTMTQLGPIINPISLTSYREYYKKSSHSIQSHPIQRDIVWTNSPYQSDIDVLPSPPVSSSPPSHDRQRTRPHPRLPINPKPFRMPSSADNVLASLFSSNVQWANEVQSKDQGFFVTSAKGQTPKILWIGWYVPISFEHQSKDQMNFLDTIVPIHECQRVSLLPLNQETSSFTVTSQSISTFTTSLESR